MTTTNWKTCTQDQIVGLGYLSTFSRGSPPKSTWSSSKVEDFQAKHWESIPWRVGCSSGKIWRCATGHVGVFHMGMVTLHVCTTVFFCVFNSVFFFEKRHIWQFKKKNRPVTRLNPRLNLETAGEMLNWKNGYRKLLCDLIIQRGLIFFDTVVSSLYAKIVILRHRWCFSYPSLRIALSETSPWKACHGTASVWVSYTWKSYWGIYGYMDV